jgi:hypothetical protein
VVARAAASAYIGSYGLAVTSISATGDGIQYDPDISVIPNRVYRFSFWAKSDAADDCQCQWTDGVGSSNMTAVGTAALFATSWKLHEFTFTPDEATILSTRILDSDGTPASTTLDVDEVMLRENAPEIDTMDAGKQHGFKFEVIARRTLDGEVVYRLEGCEVFDDAMASGDFYTESINGQFIRRRVLAV